MIDIKRGTELGHTSKVIVKLNNYMVKKKKNEKEDSRIQWESGCSSPG